ncbi:hypothetical protein [Streptomyces yokosukanensis]|uniref:hypothetical protein n=1 Tax=Streptomyces yokosukanensis TaxID=67386 RepID=UPI000AF80B86|nr:hypothetical protein [Streptomyces yokosukanensis]
MLGFPAHVRVCLFDLDGVLTQTAKVHAAARRIRLPEGSPEDPPETDADAETVTGLGERKSEPVLRRIREDGVEPYEGSARFVHAAREAGLRRAGTHLESA